MVGLTRLAGPHAYQACVKPTELQTGYIYEEQLAWILTNRQSFVKEVTGRRFPTATLLCYDFTPSHRPHQGNVTSTQP